ncbi:MAG: MBL fold metallo-hydrolase [Hyphomicrobiales bacterium]
MPVCKPSISRRTLLGAAGATTAAALTGVSFSPTRAAAPLFGASKPGHFRFKLGDFEITTIADGAIPVPTVAKIFGENQIEEDVAKLMGENHLPGDKMEIGFTPVIVDTGKEVVLFYTGNGAARRPKAGNLLSALEGAGFSADQIDVVVITHFHPDHIGGLTEGDKPSFPNARYVTGEMEYNFWTDKKLLDGPMAKRAQLVQAKVVPFAEKMTFVKSEGEATGGIRAVNAFGHTPGHMGWHIESEGKRFMLFADACNHYVASMQRPD